MVKDDEKVDCDKFVLPKWLNKIDDFAGVIHDNAELILTCLDEAEKVKLSALLP